MEIKHTREHRVECREGEVLAVHELQVGPEAVAGVFFASFYSLILGGMMICSPFIAAVPLSGSQIARALVAGLGLLIIGQALAITIYRRATRGIWVIDNQGIEIQRQRGPIRRIEWKEMKWVRWGLGRFVLLGDGKRIALDRRFLADGDWKRVRGRVERMLSGHFDLTLRPPPIQEFSVLRVMALFAPLGLLTALSMLWLPSMSLRVTAIVLFAYMVVMVGTMLVCFVLMYRESERRNPTWRAAKFRAGDWEDWSL